MEIVESLEITKTVPLNGQTILKDPLTQKVSVKKLWLSRKYKSAKRKSDSCETTISLPYWET